MTLSPITQRSPESLASDFFQKSVGWWQSQRRYYSLKQEGEPEEVVSLLEIKFLEKACPELIKLAAAHQLDDSEIFSFGTHVSWESTYIKQTRKPAKGSTIFGVSGNILYRDRGFATSKPVTASYKFTNEQTLCLRTEYSGSVFEEELKLISGLYRTRQTIISRAGEEQVIGQYLEKRMA